MGAKGSTSSYFILGFFYFLLYLDSSLNYSLKNCSISFQKRLPDNVALGCANRKLVTVPDDLPKDAVSLQLHNNLLQKINKGDFCGMSKLKRLALDANQISTVDGGSFIDLGLLKTLSMSNNVLTNLTSNMFEGLSNLTELNLGFNKIQLIHNAAFQFLNSLQTLDLSLNNLLQVTDILPVLQLPQIQTLNLGENQFSSFETKDLPLNSSSLKMLTIAGANFQKFSISTPIFPHLGTMDFSSRGKYSNLKWDIPDKTLLENITQLYLNSPVFSFQQIQKVLESLISLDHLEMNYVDKLIKKGLLSTVCKIPALRNLHLMFNNLDKVTHELVRCSQLRELDLEITQITDLSKGSIQSMKKLRSLNVGANRLTKVPHDIRTLASLETLNMRTNFIVELSCEDFVNTTNLTTLTLSTNRISKLERCVFEHLAGLKVLDLSNNLLLTFGDTFKTTLHKLEVLDLSQNSLEILETADFQGLQELKQLNVASKSVARVKRRTFTGLISLETLVVSIPLDYEANFSKLKQLKDLTIYLYLDTTFRIPQSNDNDALTSLKAFRSLTVICTGYHYGFPLDVPMEMLQEMRHLESFEAVNVYTKAPNVDTFHFNPILLNLTLTKNDLSDLDAELFRPVPKLQILDFSESSLKTLDFLVQANLTELRYLKLTDNEINVINETVFSSLPSLTYLDLSNNPFTCECSNSGFIQWVKNNKQTQVVNAHQYKCSFPVDKQGTFLLDFDFQPCFDDGSFFFFISSTSLVVVTLLTSFIYHFLKWQLVYTYHLFLAFVYDSWKGKKQDPHQFDAFVSYNVHDENWVYREMLPVLEGKQGWRLCLHHRDFQPGKPIIENITDAIYGSRKTICVVSRHYLESEWCSREIQMASFRLFDEQKDVLILLFLEEIPPHHLSPHYRMRKLVKKRTYLSWPQAAQHPGLFWQNVQRALQSGDALTENTDLLTGATGP